MVTRSRLSTATVRSGSNISMMMLAPPVIRLEHSQMGPAMWVKGKARAPRSSGPKSRQATMPRAAAMIVASVCWAPLGSAVVPDV